MILRMVGACLIPWNRNIFVKVGLVFKPNTKLNEWGLSPTWQYDITYVDPYLFFTLKISRAPKVGI